jgi:hypothetical protein
MSDFAGRLECTLCDWSISASDLEYAAGRYTIHVREECPNQPDGSRWKTEEVVETMAQVADDWRTRPLTVTLTTRHGTTYVLDGVQDDTRVSLSSLDDVDKAALRVLLRQALAEIDPPRVTGGTVTFPGGVMPTLT